jgi:predicted methyltransferase
MSVAISGSGTITGLTATGISAQPVFAGNVIQVVNTQTGAVATGTTQIPLDDTIPQNTEGDEYMTLAITPTSASNKLLISVKVGCITNSAATFWIIGALFQDSTANALATSAFYSATATGGSLLVIDHFMTAGTTSSTTFKFRAGASVAGTTTFNGQGGQRRWGGTMASSITITEIAA